MDFKLGCVIVAYNPNVTDFIRNIKYYLKSFSNIVVVDNSSNTLLKEHLNKINVDYIPLYENKGIAFAQNKGIEKIINYTDGIVFFDQDSYLTYEEISVMISDYMNFKNRKSIAIIGPALKKSNKLGLEEVKEIISSGSMIPTIFLKKYGLMKSDFFIEYVDYEWCWRLINKGFKVYIDNNVILNHNTLNKTNIFGKYTSSYTRLYYDVRNSTIILKNNLYAPGKKNSLIFKNIKHIIGDLIFGKNRIKRINNVFFGIYDGLNGITGPNPRINQDKEE